MICALGFRRLSIPLQRECQRPHVSLGFVSIVDILLTSPLRGERGEREKEAEFALKNDTVAVAIDNLSLKV